MAAKKKTEVLTFEKSLEQVESIIEKMEQSEMTLDDAMKAYESGMALCAKMEKLLEEGQGRIEMLQKQSPSKSDVQTALFEVES